MIHLPLQGYVLYEYMYEKLIVICSVKYFEGSGYIKGT